MSSTCSEAVVQYAHDSAYEAALRGTAERRSGNDLDMITIVQTLVSKPTTPITYWPFFAPTFRSARSTCFASLRTSGSPLTSRWIPFASLYSPIKTGICRT